MFSELLLQALQLVGVIVLGFAGFVLALRLAVAAIAWAKRNSASAAQGMISIWLDRLSGTVDAWLTEPSAAGAAPVSDGLWTQFSDWLGETIDAMNTPSDSMGSGEAGGSDGHSSHHSASDDGGSLGGDGGSC
jgi:uncharacterized membrane protein YgcG